MKTYILIILLIVTTSCSKDKQQETDKELKLNISTTEWYTTVSENGFGTVYLKIAGNTNGELLTIETRGDGLAGCKEVDLDENNNFSEEIIILFRPYCDTIPQKYSTYVNVYEKSESPEVVFCRTGSGKTLRKIVESDFLTFEKKD